MTSEADSNLPIVTVNAPSGRRGLWHKVQLAFLHIHENYRDDYDWFMKADDDTSEFNLF
jgi:glycoprotein-N-acetylgalactosamine 3-beta-galactosyltransferase